MYEWISAVGISSAIVFNNTNLIIDLTLLNNSKQLAIDKSSVSPMMNVISYDYQWMPNLTDEHNEMHTIGDYNTQINVDKSIANHFQPVSELCVNLIDSDDIDCDQYFSFTNVMSDTEFCNSNNIYDMELGEKILKHKKSSTFGFSALQKRIERVKCDLKNLTNKLNPSYSDNNSSNSYSYCNMGLGKMTEDDENDLSDDVKAKTNAAEKTWKCPSQFNAKNPFSELSESTQKVLGRLNLKDEEPDVNCQSTDNDIEDIEMEEDELEFTFTQKQNSFLNSFISKGTLSIIEELEEEDSSSDESESAKSTVIERTIHTFDNTVTAKSASMHSFDITDSDSYGTPMSSFRVIDQTQPCPDDTEEYFSDCAKCSVSSYSSRESLKSQEVDRLETSCTETTIKADIYNDEASEHETSLEEKSSSSLKCDEEFASEAEYDNSAWSTEDIPQSVEQSDSLYDKPYRSILKSSLPDLLESSDSHDIDNIGGSLIVRHFNKSTDLDEILDQISPYHEPSVGRLCQSMSNLFLTKSNNRIRPDDFFLERSSFDNLLETDLDSGYVSIYKPVKETEILPKVEFSCSVSDVNKLEGSFNGFSTTLVDRLRKKAGSVSELRIADSLSKLSIPNWLNLRDDDEYGSRNSSISNNKTLPVHHSPTSLDRTLLLSSQRKMKSLPRPSLPNDTALSTVVAPKISSPATVVLPSQLLRQTSQNNKITPIKFCQARTLLLPSKLNVNSFKQPVSI